jgi:hypothetical protein
MYWEKIGGGGGGYRKKTVTPNLFIPGISDGIVLKKQPSLNLMLVFGGNIDSYLCLNISFAQSIHWSGPIFNFCMALKSIRCIMYP